MVVASARFSGARPALPSKPWLGLRRTARRIRGFVEVASFCAPARPGSPLVAVSRGPHVGACVVDARRLAACGRGGRFSMLRNRRRVPSPVRPRAVHGFHRSTPRIPRKVRNLAEKSAKNCLSPARTPLGFGLARDSSPLHPRPAGWTEQRRGTLARSPTLPGPNPCPGCGRSARLSCPPRSGTVRRSLPTGHAA